MEVDSEGGKKRVDTTLHNMLPEGLLETGSFEQNFEGSEGFSYVDV